MPSFLQQIKYMFHQAMLSEFANKERIISPLLFALTVILLFNFALGDVDPSYRTQMFIAQIFLTALLALQVGFSRLFDQEQEDRVFDLQRTYPVNYFAWFISKFLHIMTIGGLILYPALIIGMFLNSNSLVKNLPGFIVLTSTCALLGLAGLGVTLAAVTIKANAKQILFPLLYFPLTVPILLAAVQSSVIFVETGKIESTSHWLAMLGLFDVIYFTLGLLLYGELVDDS